MSTNITFTPFDYQQEPSLPVSNNGPGKLLIIILAALLGVLVGCGTILLRHALVEHKYRKKS